MSTEIKDESKVIQDKIEYQFEGLEEKLIDFKNEIDQKIDASTNTTKSHIELSTAKIIIELSVPLGTSEATVLAQQTTITTIELSGFTLFSESTGFFTASVLRKASISSKLYEVIINQKQFF
jgi:hypothetical protein